MAEEVDSQAPHGAGTEATLERGNGAVPDPRVEARGVQKDHCRRGGASFGASPLVDSRDPAAADVFGSKAKGTVCFRKKQAWRGCHTCGREGRV